MAMWGRMPLPLIPNCPQEPWEAQEEAHRDRSIGSIFRFVVHLPEWRPDWSSVVTCLLCLL